MDYRYRERAGIKPSLLGFGLMRLPGKADGTLDMEISEKMVDKAIASGVNYFDTAYMYMDYRSEECIGKALSKYPRESFYLATKFPGYDPANWRKVEEIFNSQLEKLKVDYFDFYLFHNVCEMNIDAYLNDEKYGIFSYLIEQKKNGRIRHLGFSCHGGMDVLKRFDLVTEKATTAATDLREQAEFLLACSQKELAGKSLTEQEHRQIETIGSNFENITLNLIKEPNQFLMGWSDVNGADKSIAVVADVYTANSFNNPNKSVLYEAVGPAHQIYVVVEIDGYLYLTRGAVFSYREFKKGISEPRSTDEEWQQDLKSQPDKGIPNWMKEIIVPLGNKELDNEYIFYSSGC